MYSLRIRGTIVAVVAIFLFAPAAVPASAGSWETALPTQAGDGLFTQIRDWLGSLFALSEATAPPETNEAGTCAPTGGDRGCAIDPNGGTGDY